jgi:hypothetical protein
MLDIGESPVFTKQIKSFDTVFTEYAETEKQY